MARGEELLLRAFGMSGAQINAEIKRIENDLGLSLRDRDLVLKARRHEDFVNFEQVVREEAAWMSEYYEIFYCLEKSIRKLISSALFDAEGQDWWESKRIADGIKNEVNSLQKKETGSGITPRSENPLDFTTFGQLSQIITDNFEIFEPIISSKSAVSRILNQLNLLRGPIAHCCPLASDERDRLYLAIRDWFRLLS